MEKSRMFKLLKQKYVALENDFAYDVLMIAYVGNEIATYTAIVIPNIDNIISGTNYINEHIVLDNLETISVIDIRKANSEILQLLYQDFVIINKQYRSEIDKLNRIKHIDINDQIIDKCVLNILKQKLRVKLENKVNTEYKLCPDQYANVFITSDTHFGHSNILKYEYGRMDLLGLSMNKAISDYVIKNKLSIDTDEDFNRAYSLTLKELVKEHDECLISNWNKVVGKSDLVIILGDFSFLKAEQTMTLLKRLNGDKVLIRGNHDIFLDDKEFDKSLFKGIFDYTEAKYRGREMCLMHYPILSFKHQDKNETNCAVLLFGHIHSCRYELPKHSFNVGVDVNNYTPVKLEYAIERALDNRGKLINGRK